MKNRKIGFEMVVGSHNYLLNHKDSDIDKKAFYYPSFIDLYYGDKNSPVSVSKVEDIEHHDVRKLGNMLYKANVNFLEILFSIQVIREDRLYRLLVEKREEIARMNLPYLFEACYKGMFERKVKEFMRDTLYVDIRESDEEREAKLNKHLMVAYRILDFLVRYAKNGFTSFESAIRYHDHIEEDKKMKEFLLLIREGKVKRPIFSKDIPVFLAVKKAEAEALAELYKSQPVNELLRSEIEELIKEHVRMQLQEEISEHGQYLHDWEPTDSQWYTMECTCCGKSINLYEQNEWNREINGICEGKNFQKVIENRGEED
jgi:predicted nucleotidyltransferase